MAADQRKKRVNASLIACSSHKQNRVNRKKFQVQRHNLDVRPNIILEWDNNKKSVVSKRDQIAIAQRHLIPCIEHSPHGASILGDVISVPQEIFDLKHLKGILSYEVWQGLLSDVERDFLSQFLPKELEPDAILRDLFSGDNFHFGNPFLKWGASLCIGKLHPDNVLREGQHLKTLKKDYYEHLQNFHNDMIANLEMWKNKWVSCKDPGVDMVQNIWSSRKHTGQSIPVPETGLYASEENLITTPESCSWINSEVAYSSDNQNSGGMNHVESQRTKDSLKKISNSSNGLRGTAVPRKGEKIHKRNIQDADGAKYMFYVKVSKEQHERVKSCMKHASNSIQPRSLNNVLGSIDTLNVQPFERFEEEERKKLHNHWLKLATKDIAEGFVNWEKRQFQRQELKWSLGKELRQKLQQQLVSWDWDKHGFQHKRMRFSDGTDQKLLPTIEGAEKDRSDDLLPEQSDKEESIHDMPTEKDEKETDKENIFEHRIHDNTEIIEGDNVPNHVLCQDHNEMQTASLNSNPRSTVVTPPSPGSLQDQRHLLQRVSSLDCNLHSNSMEMEPRCGNACAKTNGGQSIESQFPGDLNHADVSVNQGCLLPSSCDVWPVAEVGGSYYQANTGYRSSPELPIGRAQFLQGQELRMLDLENDSQGKDAENEVMHRQPEDMSYFSSYSNQDRNELLQSFFKDQGNMPYHQQQKHSGLEFQPGNNLMEEGQFSELREQVHLSQLDPRQKRLNDLYMNQNIQENIYPGGHYAMPRQGELPVNIHDWTSSSKACLPVSSEPHMSSGEPSQSWCNGEHGTQDGWPSFEIAVGVSHSLGSGRNSDQTLFSVISECNELRPRSRYESVCSTERLMHAGNYSGIGGGIPMSSSFLQQSPNQHNYLSGHDASGAMKMNNLGWIGMPQQNSGLQESMGKPFLRSWNQQG